MVVKGGTLGGERAKDKWGKKGHCKIGPRTWQRGKRDELKQEKTTRSTFKKEGKEKTAFRKGEKVAKQINERRENPVGAPQMKDNTGEEERGV